VVQRLISEVRHGILNTAGVAAQMPILYQNKTVRPDTTEKCRSRVATGKLCSPAGHARPIAFIYLFAAFFDDPLKFIRLFRWGWWLGPQWIWTIRVIAIS